MPAILWKGRDSMPSLSIDNFGPTFESTQCPVDDCIGDYAGTDICPDGCFKYTGSEEKE
jgi:hypothetical protein